MTYTKFLKTVPAFRSLASRVIERLSSQCEPLTFEAKSKIISRGEPGDSMFIIQKGEVKVPMT